MKKGGLGGEPWHGRQGAEGRGRRFLPLAGAEARRGLPDHAHQPTFPTDREEYDILLLFSRPFARLRQAL